MEDQEPKTRSKGMPKLLVPVVLVIVALIIGAGVSSLVIKKKPEVLGLSAGSAQVQAEVNSLIAQVGKLIALPSGETPTVATITDISKLKDQVFFKNAKNGDKVLIYTNSKEAILFRPSENRIIQVGAVNIQGQAQSAKFDIWNGTTNAGLTNQMATNLTTALNGAEVVTKGNAAKNNYSESLIIDLTGQQTDLAKQIGDALKLKVSSLPDGEKKPTDADFLIIVGSNSIGATPVPTPSPVAATATPAPTPTATP
ncbi:hypothetical protein BH10PAT1_BH10PAT1_1200 [soil metagenome]